MSEQLRVAASAALDVLREIVSADLVDAEFFEECGIPIRDAVRDLEAALAPVKQ